MHTLHPYSCECFSRKWGNTVIVTLSFAVLLILDPFFNEIKRSFEDQHRLLVYPVSEFCCIAFIFFVFSRLYSHCIWLVFSEILNLNGTWTGTIKMKHGNDVEEKFCMNCIQQNWLYMHISFETEIASSISDFAVIILQGRKFNDFKYGYNFIPNKISEVNMPAHEGTAFMRLNRKKKTMKGTFFTSRSDGGFGEVNLTWRSSEILEFLEAEKIYQIKELHKNDKNSETP